MASFSTENIDIVELDKALADYAARGLDLSDIMSVIAEMLVAEVNDKFENQGPGWLTLSKVTLAKRRKEGKGAQILEDSGILAANIQNTSGADFAEASTGVSYAVYHVSAEPRSKIPLRDFFDLEERVFEDASDMILDELTRP